MSVPTPAIPSRLSGESWRSTARSPLEMAEGARADLHRGRGGTRAYEAEALARLTEKKNLRVMEASAPGTAGLHARSIDGRAPGADRGPDALIAR